MTTLYKTMPPSYYKNKMFTLFMIILAISIANQNSRNTKILQGPHVIKPIIILLDIVNYGAALVIISMNTIESQHSQVLQRCHNKRMHALNGNRFAKPKIKSHFKIAHINKGNSNFPTKLNNILNLIEDDRPDILMISEANMESNEPSVKNHLKGYNIEKKLLGNQNVARMIVMVKSDITYERLYGFENDINSMMTLKIKNSNKKYIYLVCVYRQWKLLHIDDPSSNLPAKQLARLELILETINKIIKDGKETLLIGDLNIDLWPANNPGQRKDIKALFELYQSVINQLGLCQLNYKPTRFQSNANPSLLDHMFASHPQMINSVETKLSIIADHCVIKCQYHSSTLRQRPQFKRVRNHKLLNSDVLMEHIARNERLQRIFEETDPDFIAETLIAEMNRILEDISPSRLIQCRRNYEPWKTKDTEDVSNTVRSQLEVAVRSSNIEEWRYFRILRNQACKYLEFAKRTFYIDRFSKAGNIWREFRQFQGEEDTSAPVKIISNGKDVTSPRKLCTMFNEYFIDKIEKIQEKFDDKDDQQMNILQRLIKKPESTLEVNQITVNEMYEPIVRMKSSTSCGFDQLSSKTIKMIPEMTSLWLTHLMNSMLRTGKFPRILKISKITPIKKPRKQSNEKESFRPICNLQIFEKCIEEVIKTKLMKYLEENDIIAKEQHGGRKHHSTTSAKAVMEEAAKKNLDKNKLGVIISTDLTAAFDSVNHRILFQKLEFYGLWGRILMLLKSYLENRFQFTEIQNKQSQIKASPPCSVIQGSKMSGILYTIYTNEVGKLHHLLEDKEWLEEHIKVKKEDYDVEHKVVNFVDDSNSVISFGDPTQVNHYLDRYFAILKFFYKQNKLLLNPEKTNLMIVARPAMKDEAEDVRIIAEKEEVTPKKVMKILGWEICEKLSMDTHLNQVIGKVKNMMARTNSIKGYMTEKQRLQFANAYMMSSLRYGVQFLVGQSSKTKAKYHAATMLVARWVKQDYCFKVSCYKICKSLNWSLPYQQITQEAAKFAHSIQTNRRPLQILKQIRMPRSRSKAKPALKYMRRNDKYDQNLISQSLKIYNNLPEEIRSLPAKKFNKKIRTTWLVNP